MNSRPLAHPIPRTGALRAGLYLGLAVVTIFSIYTLVAIGAELWYWRYQR